MQTIHLVKMNSPGTKPVVSAVLLSSPDSLRPRETGFARSRIDVDADGHLFVGYPSNIRVFNLLGQYLFGFGTIPMAAEPGFSVQCRVRDDGRLFVVTSGIFVGAEEDYFAAQIQIY